MIFTRWKKEKFFSFVYPIFTEKKIALSILFFLGVMWTLRDIVTLFALRDLIDAIGREPKSNFVLIRFVLIVVSTWGIMELSMRIQGQVALKTFPEIRINLRRKLIATIQRYSQEDYPAFSSGEMAEKVLKVSEGIEGILRSVMMTFTPMCSIILFSQAILWSIEPLLGFFFAAWVLGHFTITWKTLFLSLDKTAAFAKAKSKVQGRIVDMFLNIHTVQSFHRAKYENEYLRSFEQDELMTEKKADKYMERIRLALGLSSISVLVFTLFTSFIMLNNGRITIGDMALVVVMLLNITGYMWYLSMECIRIFQEYGLVKENFTILFQNPNHTSSRTFELTSCKPTLLIEELVHHFKESQPVIQSLNLMINEKEKLAITGLSGSGKSTLFNLILGHYQIQAGCIYIGGININHLSLDSLRNQIAFVPQQPLLFDRSIKENILYGNPEATEEEMQRVMEAVGLTGLILDQPVGEKGSQLSGGQRQRVAIARALIKEASIYLFDEPTSAIDSASEKEIISNLLNYLKEKTVIVITHNRAVTELMSRSINL